MVGSRSQNAHTRADKARELADDARQWLTCRVNGVRGYFGIRSESKPEHYHVVNVHVCCCKWARTRRTANDPCSHVLAVRLHVYGNAGPSAPSEAAVGVA